MKTLRLKRTPEVSEALVDALNSIGVGMGEEFVIASRASYFPGDDADDNHSVRGKADASRQAALRVFPRTGTKRWAVIMALAEGPLTRRQLMTRTRMGGNTLRPRVLEAIDGGWVRQAEDRPTVDGNEVLELTERGAEAVGKKIESEFE